MVVVEGVVAMMVAMVVERALVDDRFAIDDYTCERAFLNHSVSPRQRSHEWWCWSLQGKVVVVSAFTLEAVEAERG